MYPEMPVPLTQRPALKTIGGFDIVDITTILPTLLFTTSVKGHLKPAKLHTPHCSPTHVRE